MSHVLVAEDDQTFRSVLRLALAKAGHAVLEAPDGRTAIELLRTQPVKLVITDILMPGIDGLELLIEFRAINPTVPIIAMTGGHPNTALYLKIAKALGAQNVLSKPFKTEALLAIISEVLTPQGNT